ncbi:MAG: ribbon-helix-helix protein, CopG family [Verrucomicrobia bacterium]|nr:ribbon-helix-helix protein, CopG family [Verrucomicrobiota bacterium]
MSTTTIELPKALAAQLARVAKRLGMNRDRLLREAVEARLRQADGEAQPSLYDRSRDLCGSVADAPRDLARNKAHLKGYASWKR